MGLAAGKKGVWGGAAAPKFGLIGVN
jgi:hypothetical protein